MGDFRILQSLAHGTYVIADRAANASLADGGTLAVKTTRGLLNPANTILPVMHMHAPDLAVTIPKTLHGADHAGLADAIGALAKLGEQHGVTGVDLSSHTFQLVGHEGVFLGGGHKQLLAIGRENLETISQAARRVMEFV